MLWGLLSFPVVPRTRSDVLKFWLDAGTVLLAGGMVIWYLAMPASLSEQPDALAVVLSLAYPMGDLVLLFGIATILLSRLTSGGRPVLWLLAAGLTCFFIADLAFAYLTLHAAYMSGHWIDTLWIGTSVATLLSAQTQYQLATRPAAAVPALPPDARPTRWLPYAAVAIGYALLLAAAHDQWGEPLGILVIGAGVLTALVIARQVTVLRDNSRLLAESAAIARDNERLYQEAQAALAAMRQSQAQLVQAGKLAAVGTLAAGVAHELNQPLMVIRGQAQLLLASSDDPRRTDRLARIERQTEKMEAIISHLRDFGRVSPEEPGRPVDLNLVVGEALLLVGAQIYERAIDLRLELAEAPPVALADANQIEQIVLNLLGNARDALGHQGEIVVRSWADDNSCYLCVADSGPGLPEAVLSRLFEPFFTTKHVGQGTGLGLSISRDIARRWGGDLTLVNRVDGRSGAVAMLMVPRAPDATLHPFVVEPARAGRASGRLLAPPPWKDAQAVGRRV
jgi:signal transduction histidine kinase